MKKFRKLITLLMLVLSMTTVFFPTGALAASKTYKGSSTYTYTITTGKKDATLTVTRSKGKAKVNQCGFLGRTVEKTRSIHGKWEITVKGGGTTQYITLSCDNKETLTLKKNTTYQVTVKCVDFEQSGTIFWNARWTKAPSCKLSVNKSAKIR